MPEKPVTSSSMEARQQRIEDIIAAEWRMFQHTTNEGGRAACQGNWPMFHVMRLSQFATWPDQLLVSYANDLEQAAADGRNLVTEKYARMMESTAPEEFEQRVKPALESAGIVIDDPDRDVTENHIVEQQVAWAADFRKRYPKLGAAMRVLTAAEDSAEATSFETYLRGELGTYSTATLDLYAQFIEQLAARERNLTEETVRTTALLAGYDSLEAMEQDE